MFWSPLVEGYSTKRNWIIYTQYLLALLFLFIGVSFKMSNFFIISICGFFVGAFISATQDIALDGYYLLALNEKDQAFFVGWRTLFYRLSIIFISGPLVVLAGKLERHFTNQNAWGLIFFIIGLFIIFLATYHKFILPKFETENKIISKDKSFKEKFKFYLVIFKEYFTQKQIVYILIFLLVYRLGDACLEKVIVPFLLQAKEVGGLALSTESYGWLKGTWGIVAIILGNIIGGGVLAKYGFRRCLLYFTILLVLPNFFYFYMATTMPSIKIITILIIIEHFCNGVALMAFNVFILFISRGKYKTSFYAISTGIMAFGMMIPNIISGKLQTMLGYKDFFFYISLLSLITFFILPFAYKIEHIIEADKTINTDKIK